MSKLRKGKQTPYGARLEHVRAESGLSRRDFYNKLVAGWEPASERVSYESAVTYHWEREPSIGYVKRVADVFGVDVGWLMTGRPSAATSSDANATEPSPPLASNWDKSNVTLATEIARRFLAGLPDGEILTDKLRQELISDLLLHCLLPKVMWGLDHNMSVERENEFVRAMLTALSLAIPAPKQGDRLAARGVVFQWIEHVDRMTPAGGDA